MGYGTTSARTPDDSDVCAVAYPPSIGREATMNFIAMLMLAADLNGQPLPDVVLLDFTAGYCQPCQQMVPVLQRMEQDNFPIRKIDITEDPETSRRYNVDRIPTLVLLVEGQEAQRFVGLTAEDELRQAMNDAARKLDLAQRSQGADQAKPDPATALSAATSEPPPASESDEPKTGIRGIFDRMRRGIGNAESVDRDQLEHPNFRAQSPDASPEVSNDLATTTPSCVRVRLIDGRTFDSGTGTIVHSTAGQSTIITCAHVFKDVSDKAAIVVDFFRDGEVLKYPAKLIGGDHDADIAFLSIQNTSPLPTSPLAEQLLVKAEEPVFSIGCNNGDLPTRLDMKIIAVNRYQGPENIVCTQDPVQGRSGGGLFNRAGQLIGVCSGAFRKTKEGLYTGVTPIRSLASQLNLTQLSGETAPAFQNSQAAIEPAATAANPFEDEDIFDELFNESDSSFDNATVQNTVEAPVFADAALEDLPDPFATNATSTELTSLSGNELPTEITVIIDSKDPTKGKRVVVIPKPSPWLLELLTGEPIGEADVVSATRNVELSATSSRRSVKKITAANWFPPTR